MVARFESPLCTASLEVLDGCLLLGTRHDRQYADGRRLRAQPKPECAHPREDGKSEPGRFSERSHRAFDDPRRRGRRNPHARQNHHRTVFG